MGEVQGEIIMAVIRADYLPEQHVRYVSTQLLPNPLYIEVRPFWPGPLFRHQLIHRRQPPTFDQSNNDR